MFCPRCGAELPEDALSCNACGASLKEEAAAPAQSAAPEPASAPAPQPIPPQYAYDTHQQPAGQPAINSTTYLVFAILATVLCCLPLGIPAIVFATKISSAQAAGDFLGAQDAAKKSKMWSIIAAVSGVVASILIVVFYVVILGAAIGGGYYY